MPNWCSQNLVVVGSKRQRNLLRDAVLCAETQNFAHLFPCPQELTDTVADSSERPELLAKYGYSNWYDWCCDNWGSKWSDRETTLAEDSEKRQHWCFQSAWSPMGGLIEKVSERYDKLLFGLSYTEESNAFAGFSIIGKGKIIENQMYDCDGPKIDKATHTEEGIQDAWSAWQNKLESDVYDDCLEYLKSWYKHWAK
jgi:hypothetical protein